MKDGELKKEDEALEAEQVGGKNRASETEEAKETETSNDIPETQESTPDETGEIEETEESTGQMPAGKKEEKKRFSKKKKNPGNEKIEEFTDRVKRQMAEFKNFHKRTDKEKSAIHEMGARDIIKRILPIINNFEKGSAAVPEDAKEAPLAEGMGRVCRQLQKVLEEAGVKAIGAVGQEFNPDYHNTMMHVNGDSLEENIMAEELQKGYMHRDNAVRHSMVKVAN